MARTPPNEGLELTASSVRSSVTPASGSSSGQPRRLGIDEVLTRTDSSGNATYLADILVSTLALADSNGSPATEHTYEPFGQTAFSGTPCPAPFPFTSQENGGTALFCSWAQ